MIVGSGASISQSINEVFIKNQYEVISVSRDGRNGAKNSTSYSIAPDESIEVENTALLRSLDVVIFCIGSLVGKSIRTYSIEEIEETFKVNTLTVIKFVSLLLPNLNKNSSVIFIGSISASAGSYDEIYSASKSALYGLTKSLAKNTKDGIRFNCVSPGLIEGSQMFKSFGSGEVQAHLSETPTKQLITTEDLASIIYDICQPHWKSLNGQIINVNGGRYV